MSEFTVNIPGEWHDVNVELPAIGDIVEIIASLKTNASLVSIDQPNTWKQEIDSQEVSVMFWRKLDEQAIDNGIPGDPNAGSPEAQV